MSQNAGDEQPLALRDDASAESWDRLLAIGYAELRLELRPLVVDVFEEVL